MTDPCARLAFLYCLHIMKGNPLAKVMGCRLHLVHLLPQVRKGPQVHSGQVHSALAATGELHSALAATGEEGEGVRG